MSKLINRVGETYNNLQIVKELGNQKVLARCIICDEVKEYTKYRLVNSQSRCRNKNCSNCVERFKSQGGLIDILGRVYKGLEIIEDIGERKIKVKCIHCGTEATYDKIAIRMGNCGCKNKDCAYSITSTRIKDLTGQIFGGIKVIEELGEKKILGECIHCGSIV
ncbi:MAG: hypothetical protein KBA02_08000 [Paludibacteraceae bacterium]|nr:hypothetical protein [Paludibacteraceae bacterium]